MGWNLAWFGAYAQTATPRLQQGLEVWNGMVYLNLNISSSFAHIHIIANLSFVEQKRRCLRCFLCCSEKLKKHEHNRNPYHACILFQVFQSCTETFPRFYGKKKLFSEYLSYCFQISIPNLNNVVFGHHLILVMFYVLICNWYLLIFYILSFDLFIYF